MALIWLPLADGFLAGASRLTAARSPVGANLVNLKSSLSPPPALAYVVGRASAASILAICLYSRYLDNYPFLSYSC